MASKDFKPKSSPPKLRVVDDEPVTPQDKPNKPVKLEPSAKLPGLKKSNAPKFEPFSPQTEVDDPLSPLEPISTPAPPPRVPIGFVVLAALFFLALFVSGFALLIIDRPSRIETLQSTVRVNLGEAQQIETEGKKLLKRFEKNLQNYLAAKTVEEKARYVRHPQRVLPLMRDYYATHPLTPRPNARLSAQIPISIQTYPFNIIKATTEDNKELTLLAEFSDDENLLFDWESEVAYQKTSPGELLSLQPSSPEVVRVFAKPDNHYVHEFRDSSKYQSYQLTFRDSDDYLFGYVERDSEDYRKLTQYFRYTGAHQTGRPEPMILRIRFPENPVSDRCVAIEKFIAPRWAYLENPDHE